MLVAFSPVVSGSETALFTGSDWSWFPLANPGIVSIPVGFLFGCLGTVTSREPEAEAAYPELEVRSLTGAGSEAPFSTDRTIHVSSGRPSWEGRPDPFPGGRFEKQDDGPTCN